MSSARATERRTGGKEALTERGNSDARALERRLAILATASRSGRASSLMAVLFACSLLLHGVIAWGLESRQAFVKTNVLFNADPNIMQRAFSVGWANPRLKHPNLSNFVAPVVRGTAAAASALSGGSPEVWRERVALSVTPLASGVRTVLVADMGLVLGLGPVGAGIFAVLDLAAGSGVIFGSMPESFPLSGLAIAWMFWLGARRLKGERTTTATWMACGVFAAGVTVTNIAPFVIVWLSTEIRSRQQWREAVARAAAMSGCVLALTALIWVGSFAAIQSLVGDEVDAASQVTAERRVTRVVDLPDRVSYLAGEERTYMRSDVAGRIAAFPVAIADAIAPPYQPQVVPHQSPIAEPYGPTIMFTYDSVLGREPLAVVLTVLVLGAAGYGFRQWFRSIAGRRLAAACVGILVFNLVLHSSYGDEYFVYSQHWQLTVTFLIAGLMTGLGGRTRLRGAVVVLTVMTAVNSYFIVTSIYQSLGNKGANSATPY
jgi:hypothetical protein